MKNVTWGHDWERPTKFHQERNSLMADKVSPYRYRNSIINLLLRERENDACANPISPEKSTSGSAFELGGWLYGSHGMDKRHLFTVRLQYRLP